jgi:hypothetical protein
VEIQAKVEISLERRLKEEAKSTKEKTRPAPVGTILLCTNDLKINI